MINYLKAYMKCSSSCIDSGLERHVVLVAPEIHWNTGNIGRTCLGAGARLHLVRPLGFSLDSRQVKRAGLDYWERVSPIIWDSFDALCESLHPEAVEVALFSKAGSRVFWEMPARSRMFLVFGSETGGLNRLPLRRGLLPDSHYHPDPIAEPVYRGGDCLI
jgi:tRNA (cytidine/uridine-2'-O-)-methyltransferase